MEKEFSVHYNKKNRAMARMQGLFQARLFFKTFMVKLRKRGRVSNVTIAGS